MQDAGELAAVAQSQRQVLKQVTTEAIARTEERMASWAEKQIHLAIHEHHEQLNAAQRQVAQSQESLTAVVVELRGTQAALQATQQALRQNVMETDALSKIARVSFSELDGEVAHYQQLIAAEQSATRELAHALYATREAASRQCGTEEQLAALENEKQEAVSQAWSAGVEAASSRAAEQQHEAKTNALAQMAEEVWREREHRRKNEEEAGTPVDVAFYPLDALPPFYPTPTPPYSTPCSTLSHLSFDH